MKNTIITVLVLLLAGVGIYYLLKSPVKTDNTNQIATTTTEGTEQGTTTPVVVVPEASEIIIGKSVEGRDIVAYNFGEGDNRVLLTGGIHGGYSWNTSLVAYELVDYLKANPNAVPAGVKVTVIPILNPDGLYKVTGKEGRFTKADVNASQTVQVAGRYNANKVDLNRNFDCDWQSVGKWRNVSVSGGSKAFSEPETSALKAYVDSHPLKAAVVWYSAAGGVYASSCGGSISGETSVITNLYAKASSYPAHETYDFYETTGDMTNWLAKIGVPSISVLLTTHTDTEWEKNKKGIEALLKNFAE